VGTLASAEEVICANPELEIIRIHAKNRVITSDLYLFILHYHLQSTILTLKIDLSFVEYEISQIQYRNHKGSKAFSQRSQRKKEQRKKHRVLGDTLCVLRV
jgi:hypothetical protein